jgi:hypothetical protein
MQHNARQCSTQLPMSCFDAEAAMHPTNWLLSHTGEPAETAAGAKKTPQQMHAAAVRPYDNVTTHSLQPMIACRIRPATRPKVTLPPSSRPET